MIVPTQRPAVLDEVQERVFLDRYALKGSDGLPLERTPDDMWRRVAAAIAAVEPTPALERTWAERFAAALRGFKFVPGGRILSGAGSGHAVTLFNCFVVPSPEDSRAGILDNLKLVVEIMARGGGVGVNLSSLRPRGSYIRTVNGTSSGPCAWAELYSVATGDVIQQGGSRRGALMLMLDDWHPDIEEFITVKTDLRRLLHANLSVCISDAFMEAVREDADWPLVWQGEVRKVVRARELWDRICTAAWRSAEPGLLFIDRVNALNNLAFCEQIECCNPCLTGDTLVYTSDGLIPIRELAQAGRPVRIVSPENGSVQVREATRAFSTGVKPVYRLRTKEGYTARLTANHRVLTTAGWKEAQSLVPGDRLRLLNGVGGFGPTGSLSLGRVLGWLVGDGHIRTTDGRVVLAFHGGEKRELAPLFRDAVEVLVAPIPAAVTPTSVIEVPAEDKMLIRSGRLAHVVDLALKADKLQVPPSVARGTRDMQVGFLQALFTADGSVQGTREKGVSVRLTSVSPQLLEGVQRLLLNLGIASHLYRYRRIEMERRLPDGHGGKAQYRCRANHELVISRASVPAFAKGVGFLTSRKQAALEAHCTGRPRGFYREEFLATFQGLEPDGEEEVFDLTVPETHRFVANGLVVHNCGEEPLAPFNVCNLGALNLAAFVRGGQLDAGALAEMARVAVRFLDNVIEATHYFLPENEGAQKGVRRVGLGTMGLADTLIALGVRYGSDESLAVIDDIYRTIRDAAYDASADLAAEKGPFPKFDRERFLGRPFIQRLPETICAKIAAHGIRNGTLLCQAPTGTTSLLAGVSSGIEPVYDFRLVRRDRLGEHVIEHPAYRAWRQAHPGTPLPPSFVTAGELTPEEHVRVQAKIQEYTDASISKTTNAPKTHTVEEAKRLYQLAYELGCKGITYYRDGSRPAVLSHAEGEQPTPNELVRRPRALPGTTYRTETPLGTAFVTVNTREGAEGREPFEVFLNVGKAGSDIAALAEAIGRLCSLCLRLPCQLPARQRVAAIVHQLGGIGGGRALGFGARRVRSLPDAVARVLAEAAELDDEMAAHQGAPAAGAGDLCPSCGEATLAHREGCRNCPCGFSEC